MKEPLPENPTASTRRPYLYTACGVMLASDLELPELLPGAGDVDVHITLGPVPARLHGAEQVTPSLQATPGEFLLSIPGVARYRVRSGISIVVDRDPHAAASDVRSFLLGTVLTALMQQRGSLVLHAGFAVGPAGAVLVAGRSGRGKSTTLAALSRLGYEVPADDLTALTFRSDTEPVASAAFPRLGLWGDALARLGEETSAWPRVSSRREKFSIAIPPAVPDRVWPIAGVYVLRVWDEATVGVRVLSDRQKFAAVCAQTRNLRSVKGLGIEAAYFRLATRFAHQVPIARIFRPRDRDSVSAVAAIVESALVAGT